MIPKLRIGKCNIEKLSRVSLVLATVVVALLSAGFSSGLYAADHIKGRELYERNCMVCHGQGGQSVMPGVPNFGRGEGVLKPDFTLLASIRSGRNAMPAFQGILTDRDIMDVIAFVRTLH